MKVIPRLADTKSYIQSGIPFRNQSGTFWSNIVENKTLQDHTINAFPRKVSKQIFKSGKDAYVVCSFLNPIAIFTLENGYTHLETIRHNDLEDRHSQRHLKMLEEWFRQPQS